MPTKKSIISFLFLLLFGLPAAWAQMGVVVTGGTDSTAAGSVSHTIGQVDFQMTVTIGGSIAQGIQQPFAHPSTTGAILGVLNLCVGGTTTLTDTTVGGVWFSSNTHVADVGSISGVVTAHAGGSTTIVYFVPGSQSLASAPFIVDSALPVIGTITGITTVCPGARVTLSNTIVGGTWSKTDGSGSVTVSVDSGIVAGLTNGTSTITYTTTNACGISDTDVVMHISPSPVAGAISGISTVCAGASVTLSTSGTGGAWSSSNPSIATVNTMGRVTGIAAGDVLISYTVTNTCGTNFATDSFTVYPLSPDSGIVTGPNLVLVGSTITLVNAVAGGVWGGTNSAANVSSTGVITGLSVGSVLVSYTVTNACGSSTATKTVGINAPIPPITGITTLCVGATSTLSTVSGGAWYTSNLSVASVSSTGVVTGRAAGTATITYIVSTSYVTTVVSVFATPDPITGSSTVCSGSGVTLSSTTSGGTWTSSNLGVAMADTSTGVVTGVSAGTATIVYTFGCSVSRTLTVNLSPSAITGTLSLCPSAPVTLSNTVSGGTWTSSDPAVATINTSSRVVYGVSTGTSVISYTLASGCSKQATVTVVAPAITGTLGICQGSISSMSTNVTGGTWTSSATTVASVNASSGVVSGLLAGTANITYTITGGCRDIVSTTVIALPTAGTISGASAVLLGTSISLSASAGSSGTWSSSNGNATVSSGGVVTGVSPGSVVISYTKANICDTVSATKAIVVNAPIAGTPTLCAGSTITLSNAVSGGVWTSSVTSKATIGSTTGIVSGVSPGTTIISYTSGGSSVTTTLSVMATPAVINGTSVVCAGNITTLSTTSTGGSWISSNPSVATASTTAYGIVRGMSGGTATISYVFSSGCYRERTFTVSNLPSAISGPAAVCLGQTTTFSNVEVGGVWSSSNTSIASLGTTTGIATASGSITGNPVITYTMPGGCFVTKTVAVLNLGSAIAGATVFCAGETTTLGHSALGGAWSSSDLSVATVGIGSAIVYGVAAGTSMISYSINAGCYQVRPVTVNAAPAAIGGASNVCIGETMTLSNAVSGGLWAKGTSTRVTIGSISGVVSGVSVGSALISYSIGSCRVTAPVNVIATPSAISGVGTVCAGEYSTLSSTPTGGVWISSDYSVADVGSTLGAVQGIDAGTATITYTAGTGCMVTRVVTVATSPAAISGASMVCAGQSITLSNSVSGGIWSRGPAMTVTVGSATGIVGGVYAGSATISYTIGNCRATAAVTVSVLPGAISGVASVCEGSASTLSATPTGGTWSSADVAVATVSSTGIMNGIANGTAIISYMTGSGCASTRVMTVYAMPSAISGPATICRYETATLTNAVSGGIWASSNNTIATVGSITGVVGGVGASSVAAIISYTMPGNCRVTTSVTVISLGAISGATNLCTNQPSLFTNTTAGGTWSSSNTSVATVSTTGTVNGVAPGSATISYAIGSGCVATRVVTVGDGPGPIMGSNQVCYLQSVTLSNATSGGIWSSSHGTTATVGSTTGIVRGLSVSSTIPTISYTLPGGCQSTVTMSIVHMPTIAGPTHVCEGQEVTLGAGSGGVWTSSAAGVADVGTTGIVSGISAGTATISYFISSGCLSSRGFTVNPFSPIVGATAVCNGLSITLSNALTGGTWSSYYSFVASIGSTSGIVTGVAPYSVPTTITYTMPGGCIDTSLVFVNYLSAINGVSTVCEGATVTLSNPNSGGTWSTSNGNAVIGGTTAVVTGVAAGTTTVSYILPTGCTAVRSQNIDPAPGAITGPAMVCVGTTITLSSTSTGGVWSCYYTTATIGSSSGIVTGVSAGSMNNTVTYTLPTGCKDTALVLIDGCARPNFDEGVAGSGTMKVLPNPNAGEFTLSGNLNTTEDQVMSLEVTNMLGQVVYQQQVMVNAGKLHTAIKLPSNTANGMYLLSAKSAVGSFVFHIVVEQ